MVSNLTSNVHPSTLVFGADSHEAAQLGLSPRSLPCENKNIVKVYFFDDPVDLCGYDACMLIICFTRDHNCTDH